VYHVSYYIGFERVGLNKPFICSLQNRLIYMKRQKLEKEKIMHLRREKSKKNCAYLHVYLLYSLCDNASYFEMIDQIAIDDFLW